MSHSEKHSDETLRVNNLQVNFQTDEGELCVLNNVSFSVRKGQTLGIVGESGCGKSVTSLAIMGLLPQPHGRIVEGEVIFDGEDISRFQGKAIRAIRGNRIAMIFQEPMTALSPIKTIAKQMFEVYELHAPELSKEQWKQEAIAMLGKAGIPDPERILGLYPFALSGGMRQRVMIAMALACKPDVLICDEPTTALDVTIQAQLLELMQSLQKEMGMAILFITHDLGVIAQICDEVAVMYAGEIIEQTDVYSLFESPRHPYTHGLVSSIPSLRNTPKTKLNIIEGQVPALHEMPSGCRFSNRCPHSDDNCTQRAPQLESAATNHLVACHKYKVL
ncbi:ABC transporter ATP-binding protein [Sansalvadorimonas verongulae]|uniref:ABC transporter ATP-binding protein n=1 Tax=Sansalvadorimonas verongulae TaxID=2172824 RepID=UPI0012BD1C83|nr:ABC transporter ATP-binding protein [Sansalvadorimonas verongulae]MTI12873.1 ABC transporter ATP-binding protein [Sansalvadorimonas verongulae]